MLFSVVARLLAGVILSSLIVGETLTVPEFHPWQTPFYAHNYHPSRSRPKTFNCWKIDFRNWHLGEITIADFSRVHALPARDSSTPESIIDQYRACRSMLRSISNLIFELRSRGDSRNCEIEELGCWKVLLKLGDVGGKLNSILDFIEIREICYVGRLRSFRHF